MVPNAAQKRILNVLLDKYERSATFRGENKVHQSFSVRPQELWPKYLDDAEYELFVSVNADADALAEAGFVSLKKERGRIVSIGLCTDKLSEIYESIGRTPRDELIARLAEMLQRCREDISACMNKAAFANDLGDILNKYIDEQELRLVAGKTPEYFDNDLGSYSDLWRFLIILMNLDQEIFVRDLSVKLYNDSKKLEQIMGKAEALLYKYGLFPERETVLSECGVIRNPSYIMIKGPVLIQFGEQSIDAGKLHGDIAFSTETLADIFDIHVYGTKLVTIENLTTFHRFYTGGDTVAVYLGGYHNRVRRDFLKRIYDSNRCLEYFHFGDIDAGGFYIFEHLRKKTGIPFKTWKMTRDVLKEHRDLARPLSTNDATRIRKLRDYYASEVVDAPDREIIIDTLEAMLELGLKLEQEAVW